MTIKKPDATAYKIGGYKQIMYVDPKTGNDVMEICELDSGVLIARRERSKRMYGAQGPWEVTYGQIPNEKKEVETIELSDKNPIFFRQDTPNQWAWRVRQIPYPPENYEVSVDSEKNQIVVRTKNRKYFKRIDAPNGEKMNQADVNWNWNFNTLVITHNKPPRVISQDKEWQQWRARLPCKEDETDCKTQ